MQKHREGSIMKKQVLFKSVLALLLTAGCSAPTAAAPSASAEPSASAASPVDTVILFTNDVHGHIEESLSEPSWGDARIARQKQELAAEGYDVYLFSAGDDTQGEPIVSLDQGESAIQFMNVTGYDLMEAGNHEFDYGTDKLLQLKEQADFPILAANITRTVGGDLLLEANHVFTTASGLKIGVFGLETPETQTKSNPDMVKGLTFAAGDDLYKVAQAQVDELKKQGCTLIICLGHLGVDDSSAPNRSIDVIQNTTGINVFIDGHSHTEVQQTVNDTLLLQTGCYGHNLGRLDIHADGSLSSELIPAVDQDDNVASVISDYSKQIDEQLGTVFASTAVDLDGEKQDVRTKETNLGDFVTDAILYEAKQSTGQAVDGAIMNGGGIRASLKTGDITQKDMMTVFPFGNVIVTLQVKGSELLEALEAATFSLPDSIGAFPQVSGIVYSVDTTVAYEKGDAYPDSTYFAPKNPGSRVSITSVGGKAFDKDAIYTIATNDFVGAGGDTYYAFKYAYQTAGYNSGILLEDALNHYVTNVLNGTIGQDYAAPQGRITIR
jgi:5'-nucleotidase/UDP-sugar diphosphatase